MKDNLAFDANYEKHIEIPEILVTALFCFLYLDSRSKMLTMIYRKNSRHRRSS